MADYSLAMPMVHPSAVVSPQTELGEGAVIGPFCVTEGSVRIGAGARLLGQNWVRGPVEIGAGTTLYPHACVGLPPQHTGVDHEKPTAGVRIGSGVVLREHATVHGAMHGESVTTIGDGCYLMNGSHVGHDATLGQRVILGGAAMVTGHCVVGDGVFMSGLCGIHQWVRVGRGAMMSGGTQISLDLPPWCTAVDRNTMFGLNLVGMRRAGLSRAEITLAREAYRRAFRAGVSRAEQLGVLEELGAGSAVVREIHAFCLESKRGIVPGDGRPRPYTMSWMKRFMVMRRAGDEGLGVEVDAEGQA